MVLQADRRYRAVPALPPGEPAYAQPVDVVIIAKQAAPIVSRLAARFARQTLPPAKLIVAGFAAVSEPQLQNLPAGVTVVTAGQPPDGWTAANAAAQLGASAGSSPWLLFLDPSVRLAPGAIAALAVLGDHLGDDAVSLFTRARLAGRGARALVPTATLLYCMGWRAAGRVATGPVLLVRRRTFERLGGFSIVRGRPDGVMALAEQLRTRARLRLVRGEQWVELGLRPGVHDVGGFLADSLSSLVRVNFTGVLPSTAGVALMAIGPVTAAIGLARRNPELTVAGLAGLAQGMAGVVPFVRRAGLPAWWCLAQPLAAVVLPLATLLAAINRSGRELARRLNRHR